MLPLSARSPAALVQSAQRYGSWLAAHPEASLADVCFTAGVATIALRAPRRIGGEFDRSPRVSYSRALADDRPAPGLLRGECADKPKTAWLFTGQGSQYAGMARELFETEPVFAETMTQCAAAVADVLERPLLDVIFDVDDPDAQDNLRQTGYAQPALFAVEMGLARLWQSWGFEPDVVIGHSVGQYTAACVAGVFSLEDGTLLMAERGRLFGSLPAGGRMAAVFAAAERVESLHRRVSEFVGGRLQRRQHRTVGPAQDLEPAVARLDGRRCALRLAGHQPCVPLGAAGSGPRRIRVVCEPVRVRSATKDIGVQPHRRGPRQKCQTGRRVLAPPCAAAGRVRQERAHAGRSRVARCCWKSARSRC